ncbi:hypothetical protein BD311DRAFT_192209 [Dichomitus squalens]|uniref:Uncharacterized protein n=1 Tax=Dichomitus squalens TaxID=114155 RepID=A0A4Q9M4F7_9APHY|nr:hypothetical protein BD311DRAFT_192209 [Dichomitus squalens]
MSELNHTTLKQIAGHLAGLVGKLPEPFVTFNKQKASYDFKFGEIDCTLGKETCSAPAQQPPWISYEIIASHGGSLYTASVNVWIRNPSSDIEVNREGLKRALEKFRDTPGTIMIDYDLNQ